MSYKLVFLSLLFVLSISNITAHQSRHLLQTDDQENVFDPTENDETTDATSTPGTDDGTDDNTGGIDENDGNDDTDATDGTDDIDDGQDENDETENDTETDEDGDDEDADDNTETVSQDGNDEDDETDYDPLDLNSLDDTVSIDEDECTGIAATACGTTFDETGDPECAYNEDNDECFGIVRKEGALGRGNYDDGYIAAQQVAQDDHDELYTIIGILGGLTGVLLLIIIAGVYYICKNNSTKPNRNTMEIVSDDEHDKVPMVQKY